MSTTLAKLPGVMVSSTGGDKLKDKIRGASVVSGGHLVVNALKAEGVNKMFMLCGGHHTARRG